jgi:hypothetical protein
LQKLTGLEIGLGKEDVGEAKSKVSEKKTWEMLHSTFMISLEPLVL